ncbi:MAG: hypothetical protein IJZ91_06975 [Oscillospiraceae bacterium]|nr:hypothetical protein [Oscillospiraceae bacterium]
MKSLKPGKFNISVQSLIWFALFSAALVFAAWKCPYGFGGSDEGFYLTVAHRLSLGERLFVDEWHLSQLTSFFLLPFVKLFRAVNGSNEGIMLASRYAYLAMHAIVSALVYVRLKKYGVMAAAASVIYLLYTPFDMMTLSYNTIALDMLMLTGVIIAPAESGTRAPWILGGVSFACAVVCCPYLAAAYLMYALAVPVFALPALRKTQGFDIFTKRSFLLFTGGILIPFALFLVFFLKNTELSLLLANLPGLMSDPEHPSYSLWFMAKHYVYCIVTSHKLMLLVLGLYAVHFALMLLDRKRREHTGFHLIFALSCTVLCMILFIPNITEEYYNATAFPLVFVGFSSYILLSKKPVKLFVWVFLLGIVYSACVSSTSNMGFDVISMAFSVINVASLIFVGLLMAEHSAHPRYKNRWLCVGWTVLLLLTMTVVSKAEHCFWDVSPAEMDSRIPAGPAKGIKTSAGLEESYSLIYEDMQYYRDKERGQLLVMSQIPWCYLIADDYPYGTFSAWLSGLDSSTVERLELYYGVNPEKIPRYIYIVKSNAFGPLFLQHDDILKGAAEHGYSLEESAVSYKLEK